MIIFDIMLVKSFFKWYKGKNNDSSWKLSTFLKVIIFKIIVWQSYLVKHQIIIILWNKLLVYIFFSVFFLNRSSNKYEQNDYYKFSTCETLDEAITCSSTAAAARPSRVWRLSCQCSRASAPPPRHPCPRPSSLPPQETLLAAGRAAP